jgi:hypothetical protein
MAASTVLLVALLGCLAALRQGAAVCWQQGLNA